MFWFPKSKTLQLDWIVEWSKYILNILLLWHFINSMFFKIQDFNSLTNHFVMIMILIKRIFLSWTIFLWFNILFDLGVQAKRPPAPRVRISRRDSSQQGSNKQISPQKPSRKKNHSLHFWARTLLLMLTFCREDARNLSFCVSLQSKMF